MKLNIIVILFIILFFLFMKIEDKQLISAGVDILGSMGRTHQINEYAKQTGDVPLWNPSIFGGMPTYHRLSLDSYRYTTELERKIYLVFIFIFIYLSVRFWFIDNKYGLAMVGLIVVSIAFLSTMYDLFMVVK